MYWDQVELFKAKLVQATNTNTYGEVGERKSSGVKGKTVLNAELGRNTIIVDIKGEYSEGEDSLASIIPRSKVHRFGADASLRINMLDNVMPRESQHDLLCNVVLSALGTDRAHLEAIERDALWYGNIEAHRQADQPILSHLIEAIDNPTKEMLDEVIGARKSSVAKLEEYRQAVKELRSTLKQLDTGNLRGIFHEETTPGLFEVVPLLVINCKRLKPAQMAIMLVVLNFLLYDIVDSQKGTPVRFDYIIHEEAWELVKMPPYLESMVRLYKLGNSEGITSELVSHHPSTLYNASADPSQVDALIADVGTNILYRLDGREARNYADRLKLNEVELDVVIHQLQPGEALYKVGDLPGIRVQHTISNHPRMRRIVETRRRLQRID
jgi:exonuclease VII small subunit